MAISLGSEFAALARSNAASRVYLVHVYTGESTYLRLATCNATVWFTDDPNYSEEYIGCVDDVGSCNQKWDMLGSNMVTVGSPTVTLKDFQTATGYSICDEFGSNFLCGNRIEIYYGYDNTYLASGYIKLFDGEIDDIELSGVEITVTCRTREIPETAINGAVIHSDTGKIGETAYENLSIPQDSDGKCIPVVFGNQWNSPFVCYSDRSAAEIADNKQNSWAIQEDYWPTHQVKTSEYAPELFRFNLNRAMRRVLLVDGEKLVPFYAMGYGGSDAFSFANDTNFESNPVFKLHDINNTNGETTLSESEVYVEVPLRFQHDSQHTDVTWTNTTANSDDGDIVNLFTCTDNNYIYFTFEDGVDASVEYYTLINIARNLRADSLLIPRRNLPITLQDVDPNTQPYSTLLMDDAIHYSSTGTGYVRVYRHLCASNKPDVADWGTIDTVGQQNCGRSSWLRDVALNGYGGNNDGYREQSKLAADTTQEIDFDHGFWPDTDGGIGYGGNGRATEEDGENALLGRKIFDSNDTLDIRFRNFITGRCRDSVTVATVRAYNTGLSSFAPVAFEPSQDIYGEMNGLKLTDIEDLYAIGESDTGAMIVSNPIQYIETILRAKGVVTDSDLISTEWAAAHANFLTFYANRNLSGFVIDKETALKQFLQEYLKHEPFSVYIDRVGKWRVISQPLSVADSTSIWGTPHTVPFTDCQSFKIGFTEKDKLCAEIKSFNTDRIYYDESYAISKGWKLQTIAEPVAYSYSFWDSKNTEAKNSYFAEKIEKKYTSHPYNASSVVLYDSKVYGCIVTNRGFEPDENSSLWAWTGLTESEWETATGLSVSSWDEDTEYAGEDVENRYCAEFWLNLCANRHRSIEFTTDKMSHQCIEIGDPIQFSGVPYDCSGITVKGFAGDTSTEYETVNGQKAHYIFIVVGVGDSLNKRTVTAVQYHDLGAYRAKSDGFQRAGFRRAS